MVAFATMYSSSDEEEALLFLALEDEENLRFVSLGDGSDVVVPTIGQPGLQT